MFSSISENVMYGRSEGYTSYILSKQLYEKIYGFQDINKVISVPVHHDDPWLIDRLELIDKGEKPSYYPTPTTNDEESEIQNTPQESKVKGTPLMDFVLKNSDEIRKINAKKIAKITKPYAFFENNYMNEENFGKYMIGKSHSNIFKRFHKEITKNLPYDENFSKYLLFCLFNTKLFDMGDPKIVNFLKEFRSTRDKNEWLRDLNTDYIYFKQQY
tara:strand:- start:127 stop:771 length:645 start_codon:yes stop_codon:yes gene_type:complete